jgi:nucleoside-diphosphate-sugar epimerase
MTTVAGVQTENLAGKRALVSGGTRGTGGAVAARLKDAGTHVTAIGRHPVEHLAADEFVPADITTVEGTDKVIEQIAANGGADIIVQLAGGAVVAVTRPDGRKASLIVPAAAARERARRRLPLCASGTQGGCSARRGEPRKRAGLADRLTQSRHCEHRRPDRQRRPVLSDGDGAQSIRRR